MKLHDFQLQTFSKWITENTEIKIESEEQNPCDTCGYEEGSIYCKEHCPYEAKIEKESSGDAISRKIILAFLSGLISDETERKKALQYINELPPVNPQPCEECEYKLRGEVEPKTGHWIKYSMPRCGEQHYKCTSCGYYINFGQWGELYTKEFKYCPNCRCRMVEPQESEKISERNMKMWEEIFKTESEDKE